MAAVSSMRAVRNLCISRRVASRGTPALVLRAPLPGTFHIEHTLVAGLRHASLGIDTIQSPQYTPIPIVQEEPAKIMEEMPKLLLSGAHGEQAANQVDSAGSKFDRAITAEVPDLPGIVHSDDVVPLQKFGRLSNGVRVVAIDRQGLCSSIGLFVEGGSRHQNPELACMPHFLELMAFRSSAHLSHIRTFKTLEQLGAAAACRVGREDVLYHVDVLREYVPVVLPLMLANVLCPSFLPDEVTAVHEHVREVQQQLQENPESLLAELLHIHAYQGNTLGNPLYATEDDLAKCTVEALQEYTRNTCTPDRLILVGINVDFDELCKWTTRSFIEHGYNTNSSSTVPQAKALPPALYTGGDQRIELPNPLCHLMLGWEVKGGWNGPMLTATTVLQMLLGGGGSFSTGGPGKGMHTRLYTEVLNRHHWVESCQAASVMYADSGLFTIYATVVPQNADDFVTVLARIFKSLKHITQEELQRAKNALKSSIHMNLETRAVMMEDTGRQLVLAEKVGNAQQFGDMIDAVTAEDLAQALRECLKCDPTVVALGNVEKVPLWQTIKQRLAASAP